MRGEFPRARDMFFEGMAAAQRVRDPTTEIWATMALAFFELAAGRPDVVADIASSLVGQRREWGLFGEAYIPAAVAAGKITTAPGDAFPTPIAIGQLMLCAQDPVHSALPPLPRPPRALARRR